MNFNLPNFYKYLDINIYFKELSLTKQNFFKYKTNFYSFSGNIPFMYFNGDINLNKDNEKIINKFFNLNLNTPICFNFSNIYLNNNDFFDNKLKILLKNYSNGSNLIEISNFDLLFFIKNKYDNYFNYVLSPNINLIKEITSEEINVLLENNIIKYVHITDYQRNNLEFLKQIKYKNKIEIPINSNCSDCKNKNQCIKEQNKLIYNFSSKNIYNNCRYYRTDIISIDDIYNEFFNKNSFNHFRIEDMNLSFSEYLKFLIKYFIKEENQIGVYEDFYDKYSDTRIL